MRTVLIALIIALTPLTVLADFRVALNGHTYDIITSPKTWTEAKIDAGGRILNEHTGYLVKIETAEENAMIMAELFQNIQEFNNTVPVDGGGQAALWIGATDRDSEGAWVWDVDDTTFWQGDSTGTPIEGRYNNWGSLGDGEPNNYGDQNYGVISLNSWIYGNEGQWDDVAEQSSLYYIIEYGGIEADLTAPTLNVLTSGLDLSMSWASVSGATGYKLYYAPYPFTGTNTTNSVDMGTATDFSTTLWEGAAYYVTVTAYNSGSESEYSNIELFTIDTATTLGAPTLSVTTSGVDLSLSWSSVPNATGYTLYYAPYSPTGDQIFDSVDMGSALYLSTTLWDGAAYYVSITASNDTGESIYSNIENFTISLECDSNNLGLCTNSDICSEADGYWYNSICNSVSALDHDRDGYTESQGDCDDSNYDIKPLATETCGDGIDQDCNGSDLACSNDNLTTQSPESTVRLVFIHHSTGGNWLAAPNEDQPYGGLGSELMENNYYVSATNYGWGPGSIGDSTDIPDWPQWFNGTNSSNILSALYSESNQNIGDFGSWPRFSSAPPGGENTVIMFKSCFPNSDLYGNPDDEAATQVNEQYTVSNAKAVYNDLLTYFETRQDKLFVMITAPPENENEYSGEYQTAAERAANARAFNKWLRNDWLANYSYSNVAVFDYYNILTASDNHHHWINGAESHEISTLNNFAHYPSGDWDSHPSTTGHQKATTEFVPLLNYYYNSWQASMN